MTEIALITPLYGIFRGKVPFVIADIITIAILFLFPEISLFIPNLMTGP